MPLTAKGQKVMTAMKHKYGEKKGKSVFYASANAGKLKGVHHSTAENIQSFEESALGETPPRVTNALAGHAARYTNPANPGSPNATVMADGTLSFRETPSTKGPVGYSKPEKGSKKWPAKVNSYADDKV